MTSKSWKRRISAALVLAALALAGCGGDDESASESSGPAEETTASNGATANEVVMRLIAYKPESISVPAGTKVTWKQTDAGFHTVTSGTVEQGTGDVTTTPDGQFDSKNIATDGKFEHTFEKAGTYPYFCSIHPATMRGSVQVS